SLHSIISLNGDSQFSHGIPLKSSRCRRLVLIFFHALCSMCKRSQSLAGVMINAAQHLSQEHASMPLRMSLSKPVQVIFMDKLKGPPGQAGLRGQLMNQTISSDI